MVVVVAVDVDIDDVVVVVVNKCWGRRGKWGLQGELCLKLSTLVHSDKLIRP